MKGVEGSDDGGRQLEKRKGHFFFILLRFLLLLDGIGGPLGLGAGQRGERSQFL